MIDRAGEARAVYTQEAERALYSRRSESGTMRMFDLNPETDADLRILDLGSGGTKYHDLKNVIGLDYNYANSSFVPKGEVTPVAGLFQELPFADNTFDAVIMRYGTRWMSPDSAAKSLQEALRVLNVGGIFQLYPIADVPAAHAALDRLKVSGSSATIEEPPKHSRPTGGKIATAVVGTGLAAAGIKSGHPALAASGVAAAGASYLLNAGRSYHDRRQGVLMIDKYQRLNSSRERERIATAVAPFITSARVLVDYEQQHGYRAKAK